MSTTVRMLSLGPCDGTGAFPEVNEETIAVLDMEGASRACLDRIATLGIPRDRWAGGIVEDSRGREIGQVSFDGVAFERWGDSRDALRATYVPPGLESRWDFRPDPRETLTIEIPGAGSVVVTADGNGEAAGRMTIAAGDDLAVDGRTVELLHAEFAVTCEGVSMVPDTGYVTYAGGGDEDADESLLSFLRNGISEWLAEPDNADALSRIMEADADARLREPREALGRLDHATESSRRDLLARVLEIADFARGLQSLRRSGPRP